MTTDAGAVDLRMIHGIRGNGRPEGREFLMAGVTHIRRIQVIGAFTTCGYTVMTGNTVVHKRRVIDSRGYPLLRTVTDITFVCRGHMRGSFSLCNDIVVTTRADTEYFGMIYTALRYRHPGCRPRQVAGVAHIGGINVRRSFAGGNRAIMTTDTGADDLRMIHCPRLHRRPGGREHRVAGIALIGAVDVVGTLAAGGRTIMTANAVVHEG